jgi:hypothetical protein
MKTSQYLVFILSFGSEAQNWELIWQDEFAGSSLNEQKWVHEIGTGSQNGLWGWGNGELQWNRFNVIWKRISTENVCSS